MKKTKFLVYLLLALLWFNPAFGQNLNESEQLGKSVFMDEDLSINGDQSCASCHGPSMG